MTTERYTHLLDWLLDGYGHCQRGTEEWCKGYLDNARAVIIDQDAELARLRAENERLRTALSRLLDWPNNFGGGERSDAVAFARAALAQEAGE